jgi:dihydroorotase-like cyclic amidohydrolase
VGGLRSATRAAAADGVTTILDMPLNSIPPTTDVAALEAKKEAAAGNCHIDVGFCRRGGARSERDERFGDPSWPGQ